MCDFLRLTHPRVLLTGRKLRGLSHGSGCLGNCWILMTKKNLLDAYAYTSLNATIAVYDEPYHMCICDYVIAYVYKSWFL